MFENLLKTPKVHSAVMKLVADFQSGKYELNTSLPSIRDLSSQLQVSNFTVFKALDELKEHGIIRSEGKKANYLIEIPPREITSQPKQNNSSAEAISFFVRDYTDINKLHNVLIREQFNQYLKEQNVNFNINELQTPLSGNHYQAEMIKNLVNGPTPTLGLITQSSLPFYHRFNLLEPLDSYSCLNPYLEALNPAIVQSGMIDNQLLFIPNSITISYLIYNKEVLKKLHIDPTEAFSNWQTFEKTLQSISQTSKTSPFMFHSHRDMIYWLLHLIYQTINLPGQHQFPCPSWHSPEIQPALDYFQHLVFEKKLAATLQTPEPSIVSLIPKLISGAIPIALDTGQLAGAILRAGYGDKFAVIPLPGGPNKKQFSMSNTSGYFINAKATGKAKKASIKYLLQYQQWLHSAEGSKTNSIFRQTASPWSTYKQPLNDHHLPANVPSQWKQAFQDLTAISRLEYPGCDFEKPIMGHALQALMNDATMPDTNTISIYMASHIANKSLQING